MDVCAECEENASKFKVFLRYLVHGNRADTDDSSSHCYRQHFGSCFFLGFFTPVDMKIIKLKGDKHFVAQIFVFFVKVEVENESFQTSVAWSYALLRNTVDRNADL